MTATDWTMPNGRFRGERITRVPVSYLKWMVNSGHDEAPRAEAELKRRGTCTPTLEISGHAIDRASLRCLKQWKETRRKDEGLHAWLARMSAEALAQGIPHAGEPGRIRYGGLSFRFTTDGVWPVLKTVMPQKAPARSGGVRG